MLAALFVYGGIQTLRSPQGHVQAAKPVLDAVAPAIDKAIEVAPIDHRPDDELLVKIDGGVKVVAGSLLALGKFPRLSSAALAASVIPTTLAGHRFWEETDEQKKQEQLIHFLKNMGVLGGLLIAAADTEGKPSLGWRGRKAAKLAGAQAAAISGSAADVTGRVTGAAHDVSGKLTGRASDASGAVAGIAAGLAGLAPGAGAAARASRAGSELTSRAHDVSADWAKRAAKARKRAEKRGAKLQKVAEKRGAELQKRAAKRTAELQKAAGKKRAALEKRTSTSILDQASKLGHDVAARASALGAEAAHQAEGVAKDAKKRAHALTH
jgi:uncharacterized membrane protein YphA (DoxX/SURF4 family)